jgi:hypothetical protein
MFIEGLVLVDSLGSELVVGEVIDVCSGKMENQLRCNTKTTQMGGFCFFQFKTLCLIIQDALFGNPRQCV